MVQCATRASNGPNHLGLCVRPRTRRCWSTWTNLQQDGPNHLRLWHNVLPEHQMALITSDYAPSKVLVLGDSMGGTACLLFAHLASRALAFVPQVRLPHDPPPPPLCATATASAPPPPPLPPPPHAATASATALQTVQRYVHSVQTVQISSLSANISDQFMLCASAQWLTQRWLVGWSVGWLAGRRHHSANSLDESAAALRLCSVVNNTTLVGWLAGRFAGRGVGLLPGNPRGPHWPALPEARSPLVAGALQTSVIAYSCSRDYPSGLRL